MSCRKLKFYYGSEPGGAFIALTDRVTEGTFLWADGVAVTYANWHGGQPDNHVWGDGRDEDCVTAYAEDGRWYDSPCYDIRYVLCERKV